MIIAIAGMKGGAGRTTTALNLGSALAERGFSTLLIDADTNACLTSYFGIDPAEKTSSLGDWLLGRAPIEQVVRKLPYPRLELIPADQLLVADELAMQDSEFAIHFLRKSVEQIRARYQFILIDCARGPSLLLTNSLVAADSVIIATELDSESLKRAHHLVDKISELKEWVKNTEVLGILASLTVTEKTWRQYTVGHAALSSSFPGKIFSTTIHNRTRIAAAAGYSQPVRYHDPSGPARAEYDALAEEVIERCGADRFVAA